MLHNPVLCLLCFHALALVLLLVVFVRPTGYKFLRLRGIAVLHAEGVLVTVLKYEVHDDEDVAALLAEGVLVTVPAGRTNLSSLVLVVYWSGANQQCRHCQWSYRQSP